MKNKIKIFKKNGIQKTIILKILFKYSKNNYFKNTFILCIHIETRKYFYKI